MDKKFSMVGHFEEMDGEEMAALNEEHGGVWTVEGLGAKWEAGVKTLDEVVEKFDSWGEEFEDVDELKALEMGEMADIDRGRGCWYEFVRVA